VLFGREELRLKTIIGVGEEAKRAFGLETHTRFELGARIPGKGSCFHVLLIVPNVYCFVVTMIA